MSLSAFQRDNLNIFLEIMEEINNKMKELEIPKENFAEILKVYTDQF